MAGMSLKVWCSLYLTGPEYFYLHYAFLQERHAYIFLISGVHKKLLAVAKRNDSKELKEWTQAVGNHLYWSAASSEGHKELIVPKWKSLLNHVRDIHSHEDALFLSCLHGDIEPRNWLSTGKLPFDGNITYINEEHISCTKQCHASTSCLTTSEILCSFLLLNPYFFLSILSCYRCRCSPNRMHKFCFLILEVASWKSATSVVTVGIMACIMMQEIY